MPKRTNVVVVVIASLTFLTDVEQKIVGIALSNPDVQQVFKREGEDPYIERITLGQDLGTIDCKSACARLVIAWGKPAVALDVVVDVEKESVKQWLFS